jgi:copper(I)-binding protein
VSLARRLALAAAALAAAPALAADIALSNAWIRPARAGAAAAGAYVDVRTDVPLKLVGATTPAAKAVAFVLVTNNSDGSTTERTVSDVDLPAGVQTRFAYNGNRIELLGVAEDLRPGLTIPLTLEFVETTGAKRRHAIEIGVLVRGVMLPPADAK